MKPAGSWIGRKEINELKIKTANCINKILKLPYKDRDLDFLKTLSILFIAVLTF
jgi:hypothetical protein